VEAQAQATSTSQNCPKWKEKPLHGKYPKRVKEADIDCYSTHKWLRGAGLKAEMRIEAQDQSLATRSYRYRIMFIRTETSTPRAEDLLAD